MEEMGSVMHPRVYSFEPISNACGVVSCSGGAFKISSAKLNPAKLVRVNRQPPQQGLFNEH